MSKYTDMLADKYRCHCGTCEVQKGNVSEEECKICSHYAIREALQIADRLEQADAEDNKIIYDKCCKRCIEHDNCAYLHRSLICETVRDFFEGYQRAIADIRGDKE